MKKRNLIYLVIFLLLIDCALVTVKYNKKNHKPIPIHKLKPNYKYSVFLTSDDGPLVGSKNLNQLVLDYEFPLTVFLVGKPMSEDSKLVPNLERYKNNPYILIGNHSFTHASFHYIKFYKNSEGVVADFTKNEKYLNITSKLARLPGRNVWYLNENNKKADKVNALKAAQKLAIELNYKSFGWDYELRHNKQGKILKTAQEYYKIIKELLKSGKTYTKNQIVILMHDQMFTNNKSSKVLGELILLLQNDDECKMKLLNKYKIKP